MGFGLQDIQELTGYIEEMFSEYMTFPTILFIVAIVVALSSIACFILAPFYIKGKAGGAKTAAQVISVIDFIVGILLIFAFLIITLLFNMASDGFFDSADEFLKAVFGFLIVPTRFGMSLEAVFGADANIGTPILFYALYFVTAGLLGLAAFIVSCIARGKYNAANGLIRGAGRTCGSTSVQPLSALRSAECSAGLPSAVRTECSAGLPSAVRTECSAGLPSAVRTECSAGLSSAVRTEYTAGQRTVSACPAGSSAEYTTGQCTVSACPAGSSAEYTAGQCTVSACFTSCSAGNCKYRSSRAGGRGTSGSRTAGFVVILWQLWQSGNSGCFILSELRQQNQLTII